MRSAGRLRFQLKMIRGGFMIPNKVNVAGIEYEIEEVENVIIDGSVNYAGSCSYVESKIQILKDLAPTKKEQVFIHELLHACFFEAGFGDHDEDIVNRVGIVLYQVLKNNDLSFAKS